MMMRRRNTPDAVSSLCILRSVRRMIPLLLLFLLLLHRGVSKNRVFSFTSPVRRQQHPSARIQRQPIQLQADDEHDYFDVRILEEMQQRQQKQRLRRSSRGGDELDNLLNSNPSTPPPSAPLQTSRQDQDKNNINENNTKNDNTTKNTNDAFHNRKYTEEMQRRQAKKQQQQQNEWKTKHQELDDTEIQKKEQEHEKQEQEKEPPVMTQLSAAAQSPRTTANTGSNPMTTVMTPSSSSAVITNTRPPLSSSPVVAVTMSESKQIRTKTSRRLLAAQKKSQRRKAQSTPTGAATNLAAPSDATSVALLGQELATLERQMVRMDGYESYVLPSMVVAGTSFATINVDDALTVLDGTIILLSGWSALCGVYTTIIFTLTMVYGKLALNQEKEDEFDYFMDTTSVQRYRGFQAFLVSLILFNINIFLIGVDHIPTTIGANTVPPGYKLGFGVVALSVVFFVYREMDTIIQSATPIFTETSTIRAAPSSPIEYYDEEDGNNDEETEGNTKTIRVVRRIQYLRDTNFHPKQQRSLLEQNMKKYRLFRKLREKQINNTYIQKKIVPLFMKKNNIPSTATTSTTTSRPDPSQPRQQPPDDRRNTSPDNHDQETK